MNKETRKKLEVAFYEYKKNRDLAVCDILNDIADRLLTVNYDKLPVKTSQTYGVDSAIINYIDRNDERYKWCKVVEKTMERFYGEYKDKLIIKFFFEKKGVNRTAYELHISRRTFFYWLDEILLKAEFWAREYGLIR